MIKSHMGTAMIEGKGSEIMADLCIAVRLIMETFAENGSEEETKEVILNAVNEGIRRAPLECEEEPVEKKIRELIEEIVKSMGGDKC